MDYDRFNKSLTKLRDKKEKSLSDEKHLYKVILSCLDYGYCWLTSVQLEQDFEIASNEYETINAQMKQDLPRFMMLTSRFINPLFHSFFYMQYVLLYHFIITVPDDVFDYRLNIFYMILDKINQFSENKYTVDMPASQIVAEYEDKRGDSAAVIEALSITQRFISTCEQPTFHIPRTFEI